MISMLYLYHVYLRCFYKVLSYRKRGSHGRDCKSMVIQLPMQPVPITTKVVNSIPAHCEVYSIQHYVIKFVSDLQWVSGFLQVHRFSPPVKLTATILLKYC
jgi:hypothetical protein